MNSASSSPGPLFLRFAYEYILSWRGRLSIFLGCFGSRKPVVYILSFLVCIWERVADELVWLHGIVPHG